MPTIRRIKDCLYNCDPDFPHCPEHSSLSPVEVAGLGEELIPMPYLEISHSAKIATVVGSIDLAKLTAHQGPEAALLPGILAQAHRGIVLVDEINRLADTSPEIADVLLDVMGTKPGRLQIEETGLPRVELPLKVTVWAASNPDEDPGPLDGIRRQLSDRFDLCVGVKRPKEIETLAKVLELSSELHSNLTTPFSFPEETSSRTILEPVRRTTLPQEMITLVAKLYIDYSLESIRAAESILLAARMNCARRGAVYVVKEDIQIGVALALRHRVSPEVLADILNSLKQRPIPVSTSEVAGAMPEFKRDTQPSSILTRLIDAFKEPRLDQMNSTTGNPGGQHIPEYNQPALQNRRNVHAPSQVQPNTPPQEIQLVAPRNLAKPIGEIPVHDRVRGESDLL